MSSKRFPPKPPWPYSIFPGLPPCSSCLYVADYPFPKFSSNSLQLLPRSGCLGETDFVGTDGDEHMRDGSSLDGPFGRSDSCNMGVYPGRGPALISRADMIILPSTITIDSFPFAYDTVAAVAAFLAPEDTQHYIISNLLRPLQGLHSPRDVSASSVQTLTVTGIADTTVTEIAVTKSKPPPCIPALF